MSAADRLSPAELDARFEAACTIAREAGALARRYFEDLASLTVESKGIQDLVSSADRDVETAIERALAERFPDDAHIGEEHGGVGGRAVWVIDPIDGTTNFLRGVPLYAVSIGFVANGVIELGVIYDPSRDDLYAAQRGKGATLNGAPIHVRGTDALSRAVVSLGFSHASPLSSFVTRMERLVEHRAEFRRLGSAAMGLALVASGRYDAFWQLRLHSWDVMAGLLLVTEAGGCVNDFLANDGLHQGNVVLASTPALYAPLAGLFEVE
ncbi:inositol monophosphatase [Myxococcota bacterium]|nr:inositol monophosphatase [Myxococcota bacterium]